MNDAPVILALLALARAKVGGADWLEEATQIGIGLHAAIKPNGEIAGAWGDIPGKHTGPILHVPAAEAFAGLYELTGRGDFLEAAVRILRYVETRWRRGVRLRHEVVNQELRWAQALLAVARPMRDAGWRELAWRIGRAVEADRVQAGEQRGAFFQGGRDDRLILVYVGKCLNPLLDLLEATSDERFERMAIELASYLARRTVDTGVFVNYEYPRMPSPTLRRIESGVCRLLGSARPLFDLRRRSLAPWRISLYPSFVARAADAVRGLWRVSKYDSRFATPAAELTRKILAGQAPHGGIRNAHGWLGNPLETRWQDVICPMRWNGYALHLLAHLAAREGIDDIPVSLRPPAFEMETADGVFYEDDRRVRLTRDGQTQFEIDKRTGAATNVRPEYAGEVTAARALG